MKNKTVKNKEDGTYEDKLVPIKELWCDVTRSTLKEYRENSGLEEGKDNTIFLVNYMDSREITSDMFIHFNGNDYNIKNIQRDYERFDSTRITGRLVEK
ncbi:phage head closure protein [Lactobacillus isalae]|uniref:phage head closure protein n=1 Tax=Lactobacillus isalae TaxID=2993455 RepID=UPI0024A968C5|nr:phage head closure protein [Lactobacillus isalae]